ncbi:uncharacterized protein LOC144915645 [Branchiostoma floridae x Branchiostoma belcheri]
MARTKITKRRETTRNPTASTDRVSGGRVERQRSVRAQSTSSLSGSDAAKRRKRAEKRKHNSDSSSSESEPNKLNNKGGTRKRPTSSRSSGSELSQQTSPITAKRRGQSKARLPAAEYRKKRVTAASMKKWKPISSETRAMTSNIMDAAITSVLSSMKPGRKGFLEVQDQLNSLRDGICEQFSTAKAPAKKVDYSAIHAKRKMIREDLKMQEEHLAVLEAEIKRLEKVVSKKEKKLDRLKAAAETSTETQLHPILEDLPEPCLNLPSPFTGNHAVSQTTTGTTPAELLQSILNRD